MLPTLVLWPVAFICGLSAGGIYAIPAWFPETLDFFDTEKANGNGFTKEDEEQFRTLIFNMACLGMCNPISGYVIECLGTARTTVVFAVVLVMSTLALELLHAWKVGMPYGLGLCIMVEDTAIVTLFFTSVFGSLEVIESKYHKKLNSVVFAGYGLSAFVLCQILAVWPWKPKVHGFRMFYRCNALFWASLSSALICMFKANMEEMSVERHASIQPRKSILEVPGGIMPSAKPPMWMVLLFAAPFGVLYVILGNIPAIVSPKSPWSEMEPDEGSESISTFLSVCCFCNFGARLVCGVLLDSLPKDLYTVLISLGLMCCGSLVLTLPGGFMIIYAGAVCLYSGFAMFMVSSIVVVQKTSGASPTVLMLSSGGVQALFVGYLRSGIGLDWTAFMYLTAVVVGCSAPVTIMLCRYLEPSNLQSARKLMDTGGASKSIEGSESGISLTHLRAD